MKKCPQKLLLVTAITFLLPSTLAACSDNRGGSGSDSSSSSSSSLSLDSSSDISSSSAAKRVFSVRLVSEGRTYDVLSVEEGSTATVTEPERDGYAFGGWYLDDDVWKSPFDGSSVTGDVTAYAKWSLVAYSITYKGPDGENLDVSGTGLPSSYTVEDGDLPLGNYPLKGYRFRGWAKNGLAISYIPSGSTGDIVLQGRFDDTFSIRYVDEMFGKTNPSNPDFFSVGMEPIKLAPLEDAIDYNFAGWADEGGVKVTSIDTSIGDDVTLYATWERKLGLEDFDYVADEQRKACVLIGVKDKTVTRLDIPDIFTGIKPGALAGLSNLEELSVPYLGFDAETTQYANLAYLFGAESNATAGEAIPSSLAKVTVRRGVIGEYAFANLANVKEIVLTPDVTELGFFAFYKCSQLSELTMPVFGTMSISSLKSILSDKGVSYSDARGPSMAIYYGIANSGLASSLKDDSAPLINLHVNGGKNGGERMFAFCKAIGTVTVENVVIHHTMFYFCENLTEATIGNTVEAIEYGAFLLCTKLAEIVIPDSVTAFGMNNVQIGVYDDSRSDVYAGQESGRVFSGCTSLTKVVIGNGVESIPRSTFDESPLEELTIGENVHYIDFWAFKKFSGDEIAITNKSKYKEWVVSGPVNTAFMDSLMASDNAPEKIYYGLRSFNDDYTYITGGTTYQYFLSPSASYAQNGTADQIERWKLVFYSPTDPYAEGGAASVDNADIEYWHHEQGDKWYFETCCVTPITWPKS